MNMEYSIFTLQCRNEGMVEMNMCSDVIKQYNIAKITNNVMYDNTCNLAT